MSTRVAGPQGPTIESRDELVAYLEAGSKPVGEWRIGTEHEKFGFYRRGHTPVPYDGERGIKALLEGLKDRFGWDAVLERGKIIALRRLACPKGGIISLEPGGQLELSGAPLATLHETQEELRQHLIEVRAVGDELGIGFLGIGFSPKWILAETPVMPKARYAIMQRYMPTRGRLGLDMMFRTATVQVNLDFADESRHGDEDARRASASAGRDRALRQFALHRRQAERLQILSRRDLARHRSRSHRQSSLRVRAWHGVRALCRLRARCADVFRLSRRSLHRCGRSLVPGFHRRASRPASRRVSDLRRLGRSPHHALSRRAIQAVPGNAWRRRRSLCRAHGAPGVLGRAPLRASAHAEAYALISDWTKANARPCATRFRALALRRRFAAPPCSMWRAKPLPSPSRV